MSAPTQPAEGPLSLFGGAIRAWDDFWFSRADPTTLCWVRFWCGLLTFYVTLTYTWGLLSYIGPNAYLNENLANEILRETPFYGLSMDWKDEYKEVNKGNWYWSIFYHVTSPGWIVAIHVFFLFVMALFTVGFATRYTGILTWVGAMSYVQRSTDTVFGLDTMMMILLLYLLIGPSGATLSIDRWIEKWRARRSGLPEPPVEPSYAANFAIRLMQVHFCVIYLASGATKLLGTTWWSGTSLNLVMLNPSFSPLKNPLYYYAMKSMATHRWVWETFMSFSILFSILLEVSFSFLIWDRRWRWALMCASVGLHTGIAIFMGLTTFSLMMLVFLTSFFPPEVLSRFVTSAQERLERWRKASVKPVPQSGELVMSR
jgi:hypothetical protein